MNSKIIANGILRAVGIMVLAVLLLYALYMIKSIIIYLILALVLTLMASLLFTFSEKGLRLGIKHSVLR